MPLVYPLITSANLFLYPLKTSENLGFLTYSGGRYRNRFSDIFKGYWKRPVAWNGLTYLWDFFPVKFCNFPLSWKSKTRRSHRSRRHSCCILFIFLKNLGRTEVQDKTNTSTILKWYSSTASVPCPCQKNISKQISLQLSLFQKQLL